MNKTIGAYEAKSTLPDLLRKTANGETFTITHRGKPVADIVPHGKDTKDVQAAINGLLDNMLPKVSDETLAELKNEGRA